MSFCLPNLGHSVARALSHSLALSLSLRLSNKFTSGGLFLLSTTTVAFTTQQTATESSFIGNKGPIISDKKLN